MLFRVLLFELDYSDIFVICIILSSFKKYVILLKWLSTLWLTYAIVPVKFCGGKGLMYQTDIYLSNGLFIFERCSLIHATVCAYKRVM